VLQVAGGRGGQAIIENYQLDAESAKGTGNIAVFKQVLGESSLAAFKQYIKLAFGGTPSGTDPLVLDLDGDGLELTRSDGGNVYFDIDHDGFAERTGWVGGDDGLLARDLNGNGKIDDITELFGNAATPGFGVLATLDSNSDGKISATDSAFGTLRIWRDLDGVTDERVLHATRGTLRSRVPETNASR
jgi:hypothetical protein